MPFPTQRQLSTPFYIICAEVVATHSAAPYNGCIYWQQHPLKSFLVSWGHWQPSAGFGVFLVHEVGQDGMAK